MFAKKTSLGKFAWTFGIGMITGASVALLFAPMKGRKLQQKIGEVGDKVISGVADKIEGVQESARRIVSA